MEEYIRRNDLEEWLCTICDDVETDSGYVMSRADEIPAAKVREDITAEWIPTKDDNKKRCSNCDVIHLIAQYPYGDANFCPNCGARMTSQRGAEKTKSAT